MTVILMCIALSGCSRGGHATTVPPARGGHATVQLAPIGKLANWVCIHSGAWPDGRRVGNGEAAWNAVGFYEGGLQMDHSFSTTYGADMWRKYGTGPHAWTPRDQMVVAWRAVKSGRGYHPWPQTAAACGLV